MQVSPIVARNRSVMENGRYLCDKYKLKRQKMNIMKGEREMNWTPLETKAVFSSLSASSGKQRCIVASKEGMLKRRKHTGNSCLRDSNSLIDRRFF
jgi:hypothetical protein